MDHQFTTLLQENRSGYLASIDDGQPRVRPFEFQFFDSGRLWFGTSNKKKIFAQLTQDPRIEFSTTSKEMVTVRVRGKVLFTDDRAVKEKILATNQLIRSIYKSADNPVFEVFSMEHGDVIISDFSGNPPREFAF
ncbi:MAG TPA: pyridoxamine 5'-phosphate oxidase family protein [Spirochaetota bacterium]